MAAGPHIHHTSERTEHEPALAISGNEDAVSVNPMFVQHLKMPNVAIVPIADKGTAWDISSRGKEAKLLPRCEFCYMR